MTRTWTKAKKISSQSLKLFSIIVIFYLKKSKSPSFWPKIAKSIFCRQWGLKIANLATNRHFWSRWFQPLYFANSSCKFSETQKNTIFLEVRLELFFSLTHDFFWSIQGVASVPPWFGRGSPSEHELQGDSHIHILIEGEISGAGAFFFHFHWDLAHNKKLATSNFSKSKEEFPISMPVPLSFTLSPVSAESGAKSSAASPEHPASPISSSLGHEEGSERMSWAEATWGDSHKAFLDTF